jgi:hypothetical protein
MAPLNMVTGRTVKDAIRSRADHRSASSELAATNPT